MLHWLFSKLFSFQQTAADSFVPPLYGGKKEENMVVFFSCVFSRGGWAARRAFRFFSLEIANTLMKKKSANATVALRSRHRTNPREKPAWCRTRPTNVGVQMMASNISGGSVVQEARACRRRPTLFCQSWKNNTSIQFLASKRGRFLHASGRMFIFVYHTYAWPAPAKYR